jgi:hypothetical protein
MTDTTRDLIQRLADALEALQKEAVTTPHNQTIVVGGVAHPIPIGNDLLARDALHAHLLDRARAFLSQPEPERPTDDELWELYDQRSGEPEDWPWIRDYARAVLARCGRPAVKPEPEALTDEEILKISDQFDIDGIEDVTKGMPLDTFWDSYQPQQRIAFARAIIAADRARGGRTTPTEDN